MATRRVHSRYQRTPRDLPWAQWPVQLVVHARKFFCDNPDCSRRIFAERFPGILERYARQTERLRNALLELAHASSAEMAARVGGLLGYSTSPDTLIRLQRQERFSLPQTQVLGVDEFSLRRGHIFSTLLVDLQRHLPVDVLEGCEAGPLTLWLQAHPGVTILARDRSDAYALAGRTGAPHALQVADRFHLVKNAGDALKGLLYSRQWNVPASEGDKTTDRGAPNQTPSSVPPQLKERRPTPRKRALWEAVQQRKDSGQSQVAIAKELGISHKTVRKYLASDRPPVYASRPPRPGKVMPYLPYLQRRWNEGCHNARRLYHELLKLGYSGSERKVRRAVHPWREVPPSTPARNTAASLRWLVLRPFDKLTDSEKQDVNSLLGINPALAKGHHLKESFHQLVAQRDVEAFDSWISEAAESGLKPFESLARGFVKDYEAIRLALTTPWSTAQCEGQICRVKLIKRQGYGRAKLDLLRQRILHRSAAA